MNEIKKHTKYYVGIGIVLILGVYAIFLTAFDPRLQMMLVTLLTFFYIGFGLIHHKIHHDITRLVVIEYILIGSLGISIIFFILH
jgi:hypothetical protein